MWEEWFSSYIKFITHMATIASTYNADLFLVGTELTLSEPYESNWKKIIHSVRQIYNGPIVYGANWAYYPKGPWEITWWNLVDYIGVDAYFPLSNHTAPTLFEIEIGWEAYLHHLRKLSHTWNKKILFTEIGYQSTNDTAMHPWASYGALDIQAQANCYAAAYNIPFTRDWLDGMFFWAWDTNPSIGGLSDPGFTPHRKPAETIVREHSKVTI